MKKGLYAILAALAVFALVMTGCDTGGGDDPVKPSTTFTVTFNSNGGSDVAKITNVAKGAKITEPTAPTKTAATTGNKIDFLGWYKDNTTFKQAWNFATDTVTANTTLYAKWSPEYNPTQAITITYSKVSTDNSVTGTAPAAGTPNAGAAYIIATNTFAKAATQTVTYVFDGWNTAEDGTGDSYAAGDSAKFYLNTTLYAIFADGGAILYDTNTGTGKAPDSVTKKNGTVIQVADGSGLSKIDFVFAGWATTADATSAAYAAGANYTINNNATLYAVWLRQYTITYDTNGGTGTAPTAIKITAGGSALLANASNITKTGYIFDGWNTNNDGTGTHYAGGASYSPTGDTSAITLFIDWAEAWTVTFDMNGAIGDAPAARVVKKQGLIQIPAFTNAYLTFDGWYTGGTGNGQVSGTTKYSPSDAYTPTADITLYAKWTEGDAIKQGSEEVIEQLSLANAWNAVYKFDTNKPWSTFNKEIQATYKLDANTYANAAPRAVRVMGQFTDVEVENPQFGTNDAGVKIAIVGNWAGGTSNDWIYSQIASSWDAGKFPEVLAPWTVPENTAIEAGTWFTLSYPITYPADGHKANGSFNKTGVRVPEDTDTGPFYFAVGLPGASANTFRVKNVTLIGKNSTDNVVGKPLYYDIDSTRYRAINGMKDQDGWQQLRWAIVDGEDNVTETTITPTTITGAQVTVTFNQNWTGAPLITDEKSPLYPIKINKGGVLNRGQLSPPATRSGFKLLGWTSSATDSGSLDLADDETATSGVITVSPSGGNDAFMMYFTTDATFYAHWKELPDAKTDVVLPLTGDGHVQIASFGGLGSKVDDAGVGPFDFLDSYTYDAALWFALPAAAGEAIYSKLQVTFTVEKLTSGLADKPMKLAFHQGRTVDSWSGGTSVYSQDMTTDGSYTVDLNPAVCSPGVMIQHNTYQSGTSDFKLTITGIKLVAPGP